MTEEEKLQFLARIMGNGNTTIGQVIVDNHGTMNIHNHANEQKNKQKDEGISKEQLNKAILDVQDIFSGLIVHTQCYFVFAEIVSECQTIGVNLKG